jgi:gamma-glutamylcyclotransferase (GGCT)/AIG2-like uncharacterized protein YtfP
VSDAPRDVFVYGTLTDERVVSTVVSSWSWRGRAVCTGLHRVDGRYPTLAPGGAVRGRVLRTSEIERVDAYEGVAEGVYVRETLPGPDGPVAVYVGDPDRLDAPATWPGEGTFQTRVQKYLSTADVSVSFK